MSEKTKFALTTKYSENISIIYLNGFLDAHTAPELEKAISELIESEKYNIIVNFNELEYISSAGLGVFMAFIEEVREKGGDIKLSNMQQRVFSVFDLLGFPLLFDITETEEQAISKFNDNIKE